MSCHGEVPFVSRVDILAHAAQELSAVLHDARSTIADPDYWGSEWYEVYSGNPLLPLHVLVDMLGNVVHVSRQATTFEAERFTITYLPSWFYRTLDSVSLLSMDRYRAGGILETVMAETADRDRALPLRIQVSVAHPIDARLIVPGLDAGIRLPQVVYDLEPSRGSIALRDGVDPATTAAEVGDEDPQGRIDLVHWGAPSIRITAAPGVAVLLDPLYPVFDTEFDPWELTELSFDAAGLAATPMWGWFVMNAAQCQDDALRPRTPAAVTSTQALSVQIERRQNPEALPRFGDPRRVTGTSEVDLLTMPVGLDAQRQRFEESTRPDGVDLLFLTASAAATLASARSDPVEALLKEILHLADPIQDAVSFVATTGSLGVFMPPIPVAIRVDPQSPDDRFTYSVCYLNAGTPVDFPWQIGRDGPFFRLTVIRTGTVRVHADLLFGPEGSRELAEVVEFRERVVKDFDDVPTAILDNGGTVPTAPLPCRALSAEEIADILITGIGLLPWPPAQVFSDLNDYADILAYIAVGTDRLGREMGRLDFAVTLAGVLLPEVLEGVLKRVSRLVTAGDSPAKRIMTALEASPPAHITATGTPLAEGAAAP
jgi:hypothetical protein